MVKHNGVHSILDIKLPWESKPLTRFYDIFDQFSRSYEVTRVLVIRRCLKLSDVILENEYA